MGGFVFCCGFWDMVVFDGINGGYFLGGEVLIFVGVGFFGVLMFFGSMVWGVFFVFSICF